MRVGFAAFAAALCASAPAWADQPAVVQASIDQCRAYLAGGVPDAERAPLAPGLSVSYQQVGGESGVRMCLIAVEPQAAELADVYVKLWPGPLVQRAARPPLPGFVDRKSYCTRQEPFEVVVVSTRTDGTKSVGVSRVKTGESCPATSGS
jgi:hypothetical protein